MMVVYFRVVQFTANRDEAECERVGDLRYRLALQTETDWWSKIELADRCIEYLRHGPTLELLSVFRAEQRELAA